MIDQPEPRRDMSSEERPGAIAAADAWNERYARTSQLWSGEPNATLVAELEGLAPGRALDVGCGEGADAIWLAGQGWHVSALDVSEVALDRARAAARRAGVDVEWIHAGLLEASLGDRLFDLVSVQYPVLLRTPSNTAEHALLASVAPGGHLLVVHHVLDDRRIAQAKAGGFDPADHVWPADVARVLDDDWTVEFEAGRTRNVSARAHHHHDVVLHVQRRA